MTKTKVQQKAQGSEGQKKEVCKYFTKEAGCTNAKCIYLHVETPGAAVPKIE